MTQPPEFTAIAEDAAARYLPAGRFAHGFARGKLRGDPAFAYLLGQGLLGEARSILDLGCGQGLVASLLASAADAHSAGAWPAGWPPPPANARVRGIELMGSDVARARAALGAIADIGQGDIRTADFGSVDRVLILDVLHYIDPPAQEDVLVRVQRALPPGGRLLLRVGDASGGIPFYASLLVDHVVTACRGHRPRRLHCRPIAAWVALLELLGFSVTAQPLSQGTPFANILLVADRR